MLTLIHPLQLFPGEDHAGNTPWLPHIHLRRWKVHIICNLRFAHDIDLMDRSNGELQDLANRLIDKAMAYGIKVSTNKSKIMTNSTHTHTNQCWYLQEGSDQFQVLGSNPVQGWHLLSRCPHQDYLSGSSHSLSKQNLAVQHHQLCKQVQALQVFCHLHPVLWLWHLDLACWL